jgi:hypothetical protein
MKQLALALLFSFSATIDAHGSDQDMCKQEATQFRQVIQGTLDTMDSIDILIKSAKYKDALQHLTLLEPVIKSFSLYQQSGRQESISSVVNRYQAQCKNGAIQSTQLTQNANKQMDAIDVLLKSNDRKKAMTSLNEVEDLINSHSVGPQHPVVLITELYVRCQSQWDTFGSVHCQIRYPAGKINFKIFKFTPYQDLKDIIEQKLGFSVCKIFSPIHTLLTAEMQPEEIARNISTGSSFIHYEAE